MDSINRSAIDKVVKSHVPKSAEETEFEGYTLDQIRHHRALIAVKKEFVKAKIAEDLEKAKDFNPFAADSSLKAAARLGTIPLKIVKGLNYTDYIMLGFSAFGTARKVFSFFRKRK